MKKTIISILAASTVFLTSCGGILSGDKLTDAEGLKAIKTIVETEFGAETEVYALQISSTDHLTSEFGSARISYLEEGVDFSRTYMQIVGANNQLQEPKEASKAFQKEFFLKNKQGKVKIKDLDFNLVLTKYNEAAAMVSDEYESLTLYSWSFNVENDGMISAKFTIEATLKGEGNTMQGRNIVTNYYEFEFEMNKDGEIIPQD